MPIGWRDLSVNPRFLVMELVAIAQKKESKKMSIVNRLLGQSEMSKGKEVGKLTAIGCRRVLKEFRTGLLALVIVLLLTSLISLPTAYGAFPGFNGKIAFQGDGEIYVMEPDGSNPTNLTNSAFFDSSPAWSPDGTRIAFTSGRDTSDTRAQLYVITAVQISGKLGQSVLIPIEIDLP